MLRGGLLRCGGLLRSGGCLLGDMAGDGQIFGLDVSVDAVDRYLRPARGVMFEDVDVEAGSQRAQHVGIRGGPGAEVDAVGRLESNSSARRGDREIFGLDISDRAIDFCLCPARGVMVNHFNGGACADGFDDVRIERRIGAEVDFVVCDELRRKRRLRERDGHAAEQRYAQNFAC